MQEKEGMLLAGRERHLMSHLIERRIKSRRASYIFSTEVRLASLISFPAMFVLAPNITTAGLVSTLGIILLTGFCSWKSSSFLLERVQDRESNILDTIGRILGPKWRSVYSLIAFMHFIALGGLFFNQTL